MLAATGPAAYQRMSSRGYPENGEPAGGGTGVAANAGLSDRSGQARCRADDVAMGAIGRGIAFKVLGRVSEIKRLVRGGLPWRYEGVTHEYLTTDAPDSHENLDELVIEHHADGGSRADKFVRDERLLREDLRRDPANPRSVFYLAQTLRDLGNLDGAIPLYAQRAVIGGWPEEIYYSLLQVEVLKAETGDAPGCAWPVSTTPHTHSPAPRSTVKCPTICSSCNRGSTGGDCCSSTPSRPTGPETREPRCTPATGFWPCPTCPPSIVSRRPRTASSRSGACGNYPQTGEAPPGGGFKEPSPSRHVGQPISGGRAGAEVHVDVFTANRRAVVQKRLRIYLNDHLVGASANVQLALRTAGSLRGTQLGHDLDAIAAQISADYAALVDIMRSVEVTPRRTFALLGRLGERLGRLKLNGRLLRPSQLSTLIELETLRLGVLGKLQGWRSLSVAAERDPRLNREQLRGLEEAAMRQAETLARMCTAAASILSPS